MFGHPEMRMDRLELSRSDGTYRFVQYGPGVISQRHLRGPVSGVGSFVVGHGL